MYGLVASGDLTGDLLYYAIGRFGRTKLLGGFLNSLGMTGEHFLRLEDYVQQHGTKMLFLAKFTQAGFLVLPASGAGRMPLAKFVWYNVLGTLPKSLVLLLLGYFFGYAYNRINGYFAKASLLIFGTFCLVGAYLLIRRYLRVRYGER